MEQVNVFEILYPTYKITKPIRLIELFSGYGSQALALKYLGIPFEHWKTCEWAVKSIQAYRDIHFTDTQYECNLGKEELVEYLFNKGISANYNEPMSKEQINRLNEKDLQKIYSNIQITHNLVNIQQVKGEDLEIVDKEHYTYLLTYSFPCQDLSLAGKGAGMSDTTTRSGMLWEVERILKECYEIGTLPQILLMENVTQVHGVDNIADFNKWQLELEKMGYRNYWQDLIATDYGIPQTRNRTFMISILGDYNFVFPKPISLELKLKDLLEDNVDESYYLSDKQINDIKKWNAFEKPLETIDKDISKTLTTRVGAYCASMQLVRQVDDKYYLSDKMKQYIFSEDDKYKVNKNSLKLNRDIACSKTTREGWTRADASDYICKDLPENTIIGTITTAAGNRATDNFILIKNATKKGYLEAQVGDGIDISSRMEHHRGTVQKDKAQTLTTSDGNDRGVVVNPLKGKSGKSWQFEQQVYDENGSARTLKASEGSGNIPKVIKELRIRKLTPKECFRLMGVKDEDYENCAKNQSNSSLYHLAGDSIVVNVLMAIFKQLF